MADINNLFLTFNEAISISITKSDNLKRGRDFLRGEIEKWFKASCNKQPVFCWQGSFAMKTTVTPISDGDYDLDDGIYLSGYSEQEISDWPATSTTHSWIKSAAEGCTVQTPIDKDTCVRVVYASGYHLDYPIYIIKDDVAYLAHKAQGWIISDPKSFKDWFIQNVTESGGQLRNIVKYLKAWKDYNKISLKGIAITILATENFSSYEGRDEKSLRDTVQKLLSSLEFEFKCIKPVAPNEDLFDNITENKKNDIINALKNLKAKLDLAISEDDPLIASNYMIKVFGDRFPKGKFIKKSEDSTSYVKTSAPGVLHHDGRSA